MIGNKNYLVIKLPKFMGYPLNSIIYLGPEHSNKVVKVIDIVASDDPDHVLYLLQPLFWRSAYRRLFGI